MAANSLQNAIIGAAALARFIFGDERKRRRIPKLMAAGWPLFEVGGKPAGFPDELRAYARKITRRKPPRKRSKSTEARAAAEA